MDIITVSIEWRGASAEDVAESITRQVEQELRSVDYVKKMTSTSSYGMSRVTLEFIEKSDMGQALDQVKDRIAQIRNLPTDSEEPEVTLVTNYESVARILITSETADLASCVTLHMILSMSCWIAVFHESISVDYHLKKSPFSWIKPSWKHWGWIWMRWLIVLPS